MIRVAHVLHSFGTGGLEKGVATVVRNASADFEHRIVCLTESGASERLLPPGTDVIEAHKPPGNSLRFLWRLSRELKRLRPDVVHTRNWGGLDGVVAARLAGLKAVVHGEHGWDVGDPQGRNPRRRRVRRFLSRFVREFTCVSDHLRRWLLEEVGVRRPVTRIYNGVDTATFRPGEAPEVRRELGCSAHTFVIGTVGRLDPIKDYPTLFDAFRRIDGKGRSRLVVVGDGEERDRLRSLAGPDVTMLGAREDVPRLLQAFDLFVLPSRNEGISNTILEAMASGLPVVASAVGGNPELVEDGVTGRLFPAGDVERLAGILEQYASAPATAREHGARGRRRAETRFSVQAMVESYEAVWARAQTPPGVRR